jgi:hypothetical protein
MESIITGENFDTSMIDNGEEKILKTDKIQITLTTTQSEKNKINDINNTITKLDLTNCENDLRKHYRLSNDALFYLEKMDIKQPDLDISRIEYRIYAITSTQASLNLILMVSKSPPVATVTTFLCRMMLVLPICGLP